MDNNMDSNLNGGSSPSSQHSSLDVLSASQQNIPAADSQSPALNAPSSDNSQSSEQRNLDLQHHTSEGQNASTVLQSQPLPSRHIDRGDRDAGHSNPEPSSFSHSTVLASNTQGAVPARLTKSFSGFGPSGPATLPSQPSSLLNHANLLPQMSLGTDGGEEGESGDGQQEILVLHHLNLLLQEETHPPVTVIDFHTDREMLRAAQVNGHFSGEWL